MTPAYYGRSTPRMTMPRSMAFRHMAAPSTASVIVDGMLYVNSGYGQWSGLPGNALLAFDVR